MKPYYETELGKLYHGDCLEIMPELEPVDLVLTDPPYGTTACKWDSIIPFEPMWEKLNGVIKPNGGIVLFGSEPFSSALRMSNIKNYRYDWVWDKKFPGNFTLAKYQPMKTHELISVFSIKSHLYYPQMIDREVPIKNGANKCSSESAKFNKKSINKDFRRTYNKKYPISIYKFSNRSEKRGLHPTQKPVALMEYLIKTYTNESDAVLDFCIGSGTTAVACERLKRKWIGIEIEEKYCEIAAKRIDQERKQLKLF